MRYAFIKMREPQYPVRRLCHVMAVNRVGHSAWRDEPLMAKQQEDRRITGLINQFWLEAVVSMVIARSSTTCTIWASVAARTASTA